MHLVTQHQKSRGRDKKYTNKEQQASAPFAASTSEHVEQDEIRVLTSGSSGSHTDQLVLGLIQCRIAFINQTAKQLDS